MATKDYKLSLEKLNTLEVYNVFKESYKEDLVNSGIQTDMDGFRFYDINNTSVICSSKNAFESRFMTKDGSRHEHANLRITGFERLINLTANGIKSKGFKLKLIK